MPVMCSVGCDETCKCHLERREREIKKKRDHWFNLLMKRFEDIEARLGALEKHVYKKEGK